MSEAALCRRVSAISKPQKREEYLPDNPVGTLAELLRNIVPFIHNELLVEDLEDLAPS